MAENPTPTEAVPPGPASLEEVARRALDVLGRLTGLESTYLTFIDWAADEQEIRFARNAGTLTIAEGLRVEWSDTLCRRALEGGPRITTDVPGLYPDSDAARELGLRTYVTVPVRSPDGGTFGTLCGASAERVEVSADAEAVMDALAEMVALQLEREHALAELRRSNRELEQFANVASHDLRAPLNTVAGFTALLVDTLGDTITPEQQEYAGYVAEGVGQMRDLIQDLLAYARAGGGRLDLQPDALRAAVDDALAVVRTAHADAPEAVVVDELPAVPGDRSQLMQLFQNLLANALTYRWPGVPPTVHVSAVSSDGSCEIRVDDNGVGIPVDRREAVFEMFRRLHSQEEHPGTGIGLAIAMRIVQRHGGRMWVTDSPLGGARFHVALPTDATPHALLRSDAA